MDKRRILRDSKGRILKGSDSLNPSGMEKGVKQEATKIKLAFYEAFQRTGGIASLVTWIKKNDRNRGDFYKMLLSFIPKNIDSDAEYEDSYKAFFENLVNKAMYQ